MKYSQRGRGQRQLTRVILFLTLIAVMILGAVYASRRYYFDNLKPVSASQTSINVTIPTGTALGGIADILHDKGLIRDTWAFKQYVRNRGLQDKILAGTYAIKPSQSVASIVTIITEGKIASNLITIKPGQRLDQIEQTFINAGFAPDDVSAALKPEVYVGHPALVDKPVEASLEGYLYPESFQKTAETTPQQIISASLDEMQKRLTPSLRAAFTKQGLTVHDAVILASIVEQEVSKLSDKPAVAQVFLKRLNEDMVLGSDVTAFYGAIMAGESPSVTFKSAYNTHYNAGLTPGPISNVSIESLQSVAAPAATDWLYFVAGDDGITYFSKTLAEHEALTAQHCKKLCDL